MQLWPHHTFKCSHTLPRMKFPTVLLLFPDLMADIPYQFYIKLCEIFLLREYFKIFDMIGHVIFNNFVLSNVPLFVFELSYIFHTFENMTCPKFSWLFDPLPNLSWLCQPIHYLFEDLNKFNSDSWLFQDFPYLWEPC